MSFYEKHIKKYCVLCRLQPKDLIALVALIGVGYLKLKGYDGTLDGAIGLILGYYFTKRVEGKDKGL